MTGSPNPALLTASAARTECEARLATLSGRKHVVLARRATTALVALLRALRLPPGSEVIVPAALCANPVHAVRLAGLRPLFADISPLSFTIDLRSAEAALGPHTRVLLAVPLFGHPLHPDVQRFAAEYNLILIEDAAQAVGLRHTGGTPAGGLGLCSVYSFGKGKIGDAGGGAALLSDDSNLLLRAAEELARISGNLDALPLIRALDALPEELRLRASQADHYRTSFRGQGLIHPHVPPGTALWKYSLLATSLEERDKLTKELIRQGVEATNLYRPLAPFFPEARNHNEAFPNAYEVYRRIVNLPLGRNHSLIM